MTDPIWLSPLSHEVPWAGREPLPEAPTLWVLWCGADDDAVCRGLHAQGAASDVMNSIGWTEVPRVEWPRVESGRTA